MKTKIFKHAAIVLVLAGSFFSCESSENLISGVCKDSKDEYYFYVTVKDADNLSDLYTVAQETNTWIVEQSFMPKIFILKANKYSKGNSIQMANYFFDTGKFESTGPDLIILGKITGETSQ